MHTEPLSCQDDCVYLLHYVYSVCSEVKHLCLFQTLFLNQIYRDRHLLLVLEKVLEKVQV